MCINCNDQSILDGQEQKTASAEELQAAVAEVASLKEVLLRSQEQQRYLQADFENFRRNVVKERNSWTQKSKVDFVRELLPIIDSFELAIKDLEGMDMDAATVARFQGFSLIYRECIAFLERLEIVRVPVDVFDPLLHEAIAQVPVQGVQSGVIVEVLQQGYRLQDILIRPARVAVAQ